MKMLAAKSTKKHLIWLVSFALILSLGISAESGSTAPLRYFKQTELTLTTSDHKAGKASAFLKVFFRRPVSPYSFCLAFSLLISHQTQEASLKQKVSEEHLISLLPKIGLVHGKITENTDEDHSFLNG
jgi:hypothetical protein